MTELDITYGVLQKLHRDIVENKVLPANRIGAARHALALADKCDRLSNDPIPEVAVIRAKLMVLLPQPKAEVIPAPEPKVNRKKPS